jgi:hydroxymethylbilane synthase
MRIGTRKSRLAVWQAQHVAERLRQQNSGLSVELLELSTLGDEILDRPLSSVGGKDLFVKEIDRALLEGRCDIAVHSLKDLPTDIPEGLVLAAYSEREDPRDVLVLAGGGSLDDLPVGARVGTSSLRRQALLLRERPDLRVASIRGNVDTRLRKVQEGLFDATLLAAAGLRRLDQMDERYFFLDVTRFVPAIGQGTLAMEARADDPFALYLLGALNDENAERSARAERAFLATLEGGCQVPIAGHATRVPGSGSALQLHGLVASPDGKSVFELVETGSWAAPEALGVHVAEALIAQGASAVLERFRPASR